MAEQTAQERTRIDFMPFDRSLQERAIPITCGGVVSDTTWGSSVLSADSIAYLFAKHNRVERVVFASDVDGILDKWPCGSVVPRLDWLPRAVHQTGRVDTTGGIRQKAKMMRAISKAGVDAGMVSGLQHGVLSSAISGSTEKGTWILGQERRHDS